MNVFSCNLPLSDFFFPIGYGYGGNWPRLWWKLSLDVRYRCAKNLDAFKNKIQGCHVSLLVDDGCEGCSLCSS